MTYYLSPYIGTGTDANPYRPAAEGSLSTIDLRRDCTARDGFCLVAAAEKPRRALHLGLGDRLPVSTLRRLGNALGVSLAKHDLPRVAAELLTGWAGGSRWKPLQAQRIGNRYRWEIHLGGLLWARELPVMAGGAAVSDDFDRADSTNLGANWAEDLGDWSIVSNLVKATTPGSASDSELRYVGASFSDDHYVELNFSNAAGLYTGTMLRHIASSTRTYYSSGIESSNTFYLWKRVTGSLTIVSALGGQSYSFPALLRGDIRGSTWRGFYNGGQVSTTTDTTIPSGPHIGLMTNQTTTGIYDWTGGDFGAALPIVRRLNYGALLQV